MATLLDLELLTTLTEAEEAELWSSLLRTYWGKAACEADASVELPVSSALIDDDLAEVEEDRVATLVDLPSRREEGDFVPTLVAADSDEGRVATLADLEELARGGAGLIYGGIDRVNRNKKVRDV